jgi:hypothetical protein
MIRTFGMGGEEARHLIELRRARQGRRRRWWCAALLLALLRVSGASGSELPSVVFVLLDTTRADRLGAWGNADAVTPTLDALARGGVMFMRHHANSHATRSSMPQLMSGRYYHRNILGPFKTFEHPREFDFNRPDATAALLPGVLRGYGYRTLGVSAHAWVVSGSEFGRHFDALEVVSFRVEDGHGDAARVVDRGVALWEAHRGPEPLFLYLHFMDMHLPRTVPEGTSLPPGTENGRFSAGGEPLFDRERRRWARADATDFTAEDRRQFTWRYDQRLRYTDGQLARLLAAIRRRDPALRRTVVVVTADHGEELGEDGRTDHTQSLADGVQHVPLLVSGGPVRPNQRAWRFTEHVDVVPTLLAALGLPLPPGVRVDGRAQLTPDGTLCRSCGRAAALYAWEEYRAVRGGHHLLREERAGSPRARCLGDERLYRVADGRQAAVDPNGTTGLRRALARRLARGLEGAERAYEATRYAAPTRSVLLRTDFWSLEAPRLACVEVDQDTALGALRAHGWMWTGRGMLHGDETAPTDGALGVRVPFPDGEYQVDVAGIGIRPAPWLFGRAKWLRKSFLDETPGAFETITRARAADGWLRVAVPPSAGAHQHVVGLRVTPVGVQPKAFGEEPGAAAAEQLERLRALGYVQ